MYCLGTGKGQSIVLGEGGHQEGRVGPTDPVRRLPHQVL